MKDIISARERLPNPYKKWIKEGFKDVLLSTTFCLVFIVILTQFNGVI